MVSSLLSGGFGAPCPWSFSAVTSGVSGEEAFEHRYDGFSLVVVEVDRGLERETYSFVVGKAGVLSEHERVGRRGEGDDEATEDSEGRFVSAGLVAADHAHVDSGSLSECHLGEATLPANCGQLCREIHPKSLL